MWTFPKIWHFLSISVVSINLIDWLILLIDFYMKKVQTLYAATITQSVVLAYHLKSQMIYMKVSVNKIFFKDMNVFTVKIFPSGISAVNNRQQTSHFSRSWKHLFQSAYPNTSNCIYRSTKAVLCTNLLLFRRLTFAIHAAIGCIRIHPHPNKLPFIIRDSAPLLPLVELTRWCTGWDRLVKNA